MSRQLLDGVDKLQAFEIHQETDRGAVGAAAEAMVKLLLRADREGRRFFVVEGAAGLELAARFLERHAPLDDIHYVDPAKQFGDEGFGNQAAHRALTP